MWSSTASTAAHQRARFMQPNPARWMRPDADRWVRPDVARFLSPGVRPQDVFPALSRKYNPNQPRVPKGNPDGGQWTLGGLGSRWRIDLTGTGVAGATPAVSSGRDDRRVISDADPETIKPGQQYAQVRGRGGGGTRTVTINGREFELTPAQGTLLDALKARAASAASRVRSVNPNWKPPASAYESPAGLISAYRADAEAAEAWMSRFLDVGPGPYANRCIVAPIDRRLRVGEQRELNEFLVTDGCHTCGTRVAGTRSGNAVGDHQRPTALNYLGLAQRIYPQCAGCSARQGGYISWLTRSQ